MSSSVILEASLQACKEAGVLSCKNEFIEFSEKLDELRKIFDILHARPSGFMICSLREAYIWLQVGLQLNGSLAAMMLNPK